MSKRPGDPGYAPGWCIHFRSMGQHKTCEAGVAYDTFKGVPHSRQPCFTGPTLEERVACEHRRVPTDEEVKAHKEWATANWNKLSTVLLGIRPWREKWTNKGHAEVVECPACKGKLHLTISRTNNHVHGRCETPGCVSWME